MKAYQRLIKERKELENPKEKISDVNVLEVKQISYSDSKKIILDYEWLGTMGLTVASYGLLHKGEIVGALNFGYTGGNESRNICGKNLSEKAICLVRGACTHWTPKDAPSYFISKAVKQAYKKFGWKIFFAYADESAGEIGTIYQACNWFYIGKGLGRKNRMREYYISPITGQMLSERSLRNRGWKKNEIIKKGWKIKYSKPKHKYVWFEGSKSQKRKLINLCKYEFREYPKRTHSIKIFA